MVQHRPTPEAACRAIERRPREDCSALRPLGGAQDVGRTEAPSLQSAMGAMCGVIEVDGAQVGPASPSLSSCRYFMGRRGDASCPLCARRARSGSAPHGLAGASRHFLTATWVVLMVGEPS
ncbi:uncharacterized protein SOCEGT47_016350 [Sorangium cellulosum]|uniref:Uncharacterized protein n=1 Tax=Sorangium cellulosum TaxID=56 RepID=A0A4P2PX98_SORCE|nr:uncharacterized protein SOCEGT47_016350 [Sorangium cellulosum]